MPQLVGTTVQAGSIQQAIERLADVGFVEGGPLTDPKTHSGWGSPLPSQASRSRYLDEETLGSRNVLRVVTPCPSREVTFVNAK